MFVSVIVSYSVRSEPVFQEGKYDKHTFSIIYMALVVIYYASV